MESLQWQAHAHYLQQPRQLQVPESLAAKWLRHDPLLLRSLIDLSLELQVPPSGVSVDLVHGVWGSDPILTLELCAVRVDADSPLPFARLTAATVACQHQTAPPRGCQVAM